MKRKCLTGVPSAPRNPLEIRFLLDQFALVNDENFCCANTDSNKQIFKIFIFINFIFKRFKYKYIWRKKITKVLKNYT